MKSIYEKETDDFVRIVSDALMNYARYDLVLRNFETESEFNLFAAELMQIIDAR